MERDELEFRCWYFEERLRLWANKAMLLDRLVKEMGPMPSSVEFRLRNGEEEFLAGNRAVTERIKEWLEQRK